MRKCIPPCLAAAAALALGCSSEPESPATIVVFAGQETDAFTRDPVPTQLTLRAIDLDGNTTTLTSVAWPTDSFDMGELDNSQTAAIEATLEDAAQQPLLRGRTVYYSLWSLYGYDVPVFVGRVDELSRPTGTLPIARTGGCVGVVGAQFLVMAGGDDAVDATGAAVPSTRMAAYDLAAWGAVSLSFELPRSPTAMPIVLGEFALLVDDGGASWFDFATYESAEATAPDGISFAEVSGGQVVYGDDGSAYVVGATRSTTETDGVLRVTPDVAIEALRLNTPRRGAAATWVSGLGLVVAGGSSTGSGVEVLAQDATAFASLDYAADATTGATAAALGEQRVLLSGGLASGDSTSAPSRLIDLSCSAACAAVVIDATPALPLSSGAAYAVDANAAFVVGEEQGGAAGARTVAYLIEGLGTAPTIREVPLREPRAGAISVQLMGNLVAILGGYDPSKAPVRSVEVFVPR